MERVDPVKQEAPSLRPWRVLMIAGAVLALLATGCERAPESSGAPGAGPASRAASTVAAGDPYLVTIRVDSASGRVGAIQFEIEPPAGQGSFVAEGTAAECDSLLGEALAAFSSHPDGKLVGALVDVAGFETPVEVARCTYLSPGAVSADAFRVRVTDASDPQAVALAETPSVVVSEVRRVE